MVDLYALRNPQSLILKDGNVVSAKVGFGPERDLNLNVPVGSHQCLPLGYHDMNFFEDLRI